MDTDAQGDILLATWMQKSEVPEGDEITGRSLIVHKWTSPWHFPGAANPQKQTFQAELS
jgi:hypothetical protein